jgi:hypothetical protein
MKKTFALILAFSFVFLLSFTACKKTDKPKENTKKETTTEEITLSNLVDDEEEEPVDIGAFSGYEAAEGGAILPVKDVVIGDPLSDAYLLYEVIAEYPNDPKPSVLFSSGRYYYDKVESEPAEDENDDEKDGDKETKSSSKPDGKIYKIISYNEAYDFICGENTLEQVKSSMGGGVEVLTDAEQVPFINDKITPIYTLTYTAGTNTLSFYFQDDYLVAAELKSHD